MVLIISGKACASHYFERLAGKPLPIYGNGSNIRDWLYVEDHASALLSYWKKDKLDVVTILVEKMNGLILN